MDKYAIAFILEKNNELEKISNFLKQYGINMDNNYFHITICGFESDNKEFLIAKVKEFANKTLPFKIQFSHLGTFLTNDNIIFLAPYYSKRLFMCHKNLIHTICKNKDIVLSEYYKSNIWSPHCTLSNQISNDKYKDILNNIKNLISFPFDATIFKIDIYEYSHLKEKIFEVNLTKKG